MVHRLFAEQSGWEEAQRPCVTSQPAEVGLLTVDAARLEAICIAEWKNLPTPFALTIWLGDTTTDELSLSLSRPVIVIAGCGGRCTLGTQRTRSPLSIIMLRRGEYAVTIIIVWV